MMIALLMGWIMAGAKTVPFGQGQLTVKTVAKNAVRIQYTEGKSVENDLPDWLYVKHDEVKSRDIRVDVDAAGQTLRISDKQGRVVFTATSHQFRDGVAQ